MSQRPWTAILGRDNQYKAINIQASVDREKAANEVRIQNAGHALIAMFPGSFADATTTYRKPVSPTTGGSGTVDPFDNRYFSEVIKGIP